jgi:hypothetical protein
MDLLGEGEKVAESIAQSWFFFMLRLTLDLAWVQRARALLQLSKTGGKRPTSNPIGKKVHARLTVTAREQGDDEANLVWRRSMSSHVTSLSLTRARGTSKPN